MYYGWKGGGGTWSGGEFWVDGVNKGSAASAALTGGDITPTGASVNTKSGFSIISYTGTGSDGDTVAHGLTKEPAFVIVKKYEESGNWGVYHQGLSSNAKVLTLNTTNAETTPTDNFFTWSSTTTDLLGLGDNTITNDSTEGTVAYLWAEIPGLQKFGSYQGNGSASSGVWVELGFKPALLITKKISSTSNWIIWDKERSPYNLCNNYLYVNDNQEETTDGSNGVDFLANGFKMYNNYTDANNSSADYIYCAWAEAPFRNIYGATGTAR